MSGETVRCFIAVEMPRVVLDLLAGLQHSMQAGVAAAETREALRWVRPEGIHLTLKFLGSVAVDRLPDLESALRAHLEGSSQCSLMVGGLGMFPGRTRPRVIWAGVSGEIAQIAALQQRVELATVPLGFPSEQRPFSPHLTLGRVREDLAAERRRALGGYVASLQADARVELRVEEISLMRSELLRGGARYSRLAGIDLKSPAGR